MRTLYNTYIFILVLAISLMIGAFVMEASANEDSRKSELEDLPKVENLTQETFDSQSRLIDQNYSDYSSFSFQMKIPNELRVVPQNELINEYDGSRISGVIFYAVGPATNTLRPYVTVKVNNLKRITSAKNWFITEILRLGYTLKAIEGDDYRDDFEAFYVRLDIKGNTEIVRTRGFLNGDQIVVVEYSIPLALWNKDRDKQILSIQSFEFSNDVSVIPAEPVQKYSYLDSFHMEYPKSWNLKTNFDNKVNEINLNLKTADEAGFLLAEIDVDVLSGRSLRDRLDKISYPVELASRLKGRQEAIVNKGYDFDEHTAASPIPVSFETSLNVTEVYPLRRKQSDTFLNTKDIPISKEYWVTVIRRLDESEKNYLITMKAPHRKNDLIKWSTATDAYRYIIQSIQ